MTYKTCVSIAEKTPKKLKQTLAKALKKSDYAEIRFDFLNPNSVPENLPPSELGLNVQTIFFKSFLIRFNASGTKSGFKKSNLISA